MVPISAWRFLEFGSATLGLIWCWFASIVFDFRWVLIPVSVCFFFFFSSSSSPTSSELMKNELWREDALIYFVFHLHFFFLNQSMNWSVCWERVREGGGGGGGLNPPKRRPVWGRGGLKRRWTVECVSEANLKLIFRLLIKLIKFILPRVVGGAWTHRNEPERRWIVQCLLETLQKGQFPTCLWMCQSLKLKSTHSLNVNLRWPIGNDSINSLRLMGCEVIEFLVAGTRLDFWLFFHKMHSTALNVNRIWLAQFEEGFVGHNWDSNCDRWGCYKNVA